MLPQFALSDPDRTAKTIAAVFARTAAPLLIDDVVLVLAELWNVTDTLPAASPKEAVTPNSADALVRMQAREHFSKVWEEVRSLRQPQRAALLLNLRDRDGRNALAHVLLAGIATADEIAETIGIAPARLSEIWNDLPLNDVAIGAMLGITPQQVINLRKAARERLRRRIS